MDLDMIVNHALFEVPYGDDEMVLVSDIEFASMCEHHMLPFLGRANVAHIPDNRVIGLSKILRIVEMYAHRLQAQERLTNETADALGPAISPSVLLEGEHSCASLRGVKKHGLSMKTRAARGAFSERPDLGEEFHRMLGR